MITKTAKMSLVRDDPMQCFNIPKDFYLHIVFPANNNTECNCPLVVLNNCYNFSVCECFIDVTDFDSSSISICLANNRTDVYQLCFHQLSGERNNSYVQFYVRRLNAGCPQMVRKFVAAFKITQGSYYIYIYNSVYSIIYLH